MAKWEKEEKMCCLCKGKTGKNMDPGDKNWVCVGKEKNIINAYLNALIEGCKNYSNCPKAGVGNGTASKAPSASGTEGENKAENEKASKVENASGAENESGAENKSEDKVAPTPTPATADADAATASSTGKKVGNLECKKLVLEHYEKLYYCYIEGRKVRAKNISVISACIALVITVLACTLVPVIKDWNVVKTESTTKINIVESRNYGRE